MNVVLHLVCG